MESGDRISRIGGEPVEGIVARVVVDMGEEPGTIVAVRCGETTRMVCAEACETCETCPKAETLHRLPPGMPEAAFRVPLDQIQHDGATMPCADGVDVDSDHDMN